MIHCIQSQKCTHLRNSSALKCLFIMLSGWDSSSAEITVCHCASNLGMHPSAEISQVPTWQTRYLGSDPRLCYWMCVRDMVNWHTTKSQLVLSVYPAGLKLFFMCVWGVVVVLQLVVHYHPLLRPPVDQATSQKWSAGKLHSHKVGRLRQLYRGKWINSVSSCLETLQLLPLKAFL